MSEQDKTRQHLAEVLLKFHRERPDAAFADVVGGLQTYTGDDNIDGLEVGALLTEYGYAEEWIQWIERDTKREADRRKRPKVTMRPPVVCDGED